MADQEQQAREIQMFGETVEQMVKAKPDIYSNLMYVAAILSDAQEVNNRELARQFINKAKFFIKEELNARTWAKEMGF